jgi:hypothetical protein
VIVVAQVHALADAIQRVKGAYGRHIGKSEKAMVALPTSPSIMRSR